MIPNEHQYVVSSAEGKFLMEKSRWPKLILASDKSGHDGEPMEVLTQEKSLVSQKVTVTNTDKSCEEQAHKVQLSPDMGTKEGFQPTLELSAKEDLMDNISVQSMEVGEDVEEQG